MSLRLGMATKGPVVPSMIFRSRTTKASSNVIEQNACRRSPASSMSFTRTSVISTAHLRIESLFGRRTRKHKLALVSGSFHRLLTATSHSHHTPDAAGQQPPGHPPRLKALRNSPKYAVPLPLMPCPRQSSPASSRASLAIHGDNCSAAACSRLKSRPPACRVFPWRSASSRGCKGRGDAAGRQTPYTAAVARPSGGRTTTKFINPNPLSVRSVHRGHGKRPDHG